MSDGSNGANGKAATATQRQRQRSWRWRTPIRSRASRRSTSCPASERVYLHGRRPARARAPHHGRRRASRRSTSTTPSGPRAVDLHQGLPKLRQPWIDRARRARRHELQPDALRAPRRDHRGDALRGAARGRRRPSSCATRSRAGAPSSRRTSTTRSRADDHRPQLPGEDQRQHRQLGRVARRSTKRSRSCAGRRAGAPTR